jgi:hypothetical protein
MSLSRLKELLPVPLSYPLERGQTLGTLQGGRAANGDCTNRGASEA